LLELIQGLDEKKKQKQTFSDVASNKFLSCQKDNMLNEMNYPIKPNCEIPGYKKKIRTKVGVVLGGRAVITIKESKFPGHHLSPVNRDNI